MSALAAPLRQQALPRISGALAEAIALAGICAAWLLANLATLTRYPLPWIDEIQFADPAVRWASGEGFTSTVWIAQAADAFWAGNAPLYSGLLCGWLALLGTSAEAVRSLNLVLHLAAVAVWWWIAASRGWVATRRGRIALVVLLLCGHAITFGVRMARYDVLALLLVALAVLAWTGPASTRRLLALAAVCALAPATGLALLPAAAVAIALAVAMQGRSAWPRAAACAIGLAAGVLALMAFFRWHGVWDAFRASTSAVGVIGQGFGDKLAGLPRVYLADKSALLLAIAALVLPARPGLRYALALAALLPATLQLAGKFPVYYAWMIFVPLAIAVCGAQARGRRAQVAAALVAAAVLVGLPLRLAGVAANWNAFDPVQFDAYAQRWLRADDRLIADFKGYYAVRRHAQGMFAPTALKVMRPHERDAVTALWLRPDDLPRVAAALGGEWREAAPRLAAGSGVPSVWTRLVREFGEQDYPLALYRRVD